MRENLSRLDPKTALAAFKCEQTVDQRRPECDHVVQVSCHVHKEIVKGFRALPACVEKVRTGLLAFRLTIFPDPPAIPDLFR
jgi:hypothetical protein